MDKIVVVMPTYNELENIKKMIPVLLDDIFPKLKKVQMHLLIVDGNSPDGTGKYVQSILKNRKDLHLLLEPEKRGLGWAYVWGFRYAMNKLKADAVIEMDSDFQHPPRFVIPMVEAYLNGADYVIGSRYIKGGSIPSQWALSRRLVSYFGNLFIRLVLLKFRIHDLTTGFRLTRVKGVLDKIDLENIKELKRFAYKVDLLYQSIKLAKKVVEIPLEFAPRTQEKSKFDTKEMISTFRLAIILGVLDKKRFIKFGTVGFVGYLVNATGLWFFSRYDHVLPEPLIWALAVELAIINNFLFNNFWTFRQERIQGLHKWILKFFQFNLTSMGALMIQTVAGSIGVAIFGSQYRQFLLPFIIVLFIMPYNYFMYNAIIWRTWRVPFVEKLRNFIKGESSKFLSF